MSNTSVRPAHLGHYGVREEIFTSAGYWRQVFDDVWIWDEPVDVLLAPATPRGVHEDDQPGQPRPEVPVRRYD